MRTIDRLIIHCSATPEGRNYTVSDIDHWHRQRGFDGIGYHYVIYRDGSVHAGRPVERAGAHCTGYNATSIGICYIGGCDRTGNPKDTRTDAQKAALRQLVATLHSRWPQATIHVPQRICCQACPSFDVQEWLKTTDL